MNQYKYQIGIVILAIAFLLFYNYNSNKIIELKGEYNILEKQFKAQKENIALLEEYRKKEKDSLTKDIVVREEENKKLRYRNRTLQDKIDGIKKRPYKTPTNLKTAVAYYNVEYKTEENKIVEDKVGLGLTTAVAVVSDLEEGKKCEEIIPLKDEQLKDKGKEIANLNKDKEDLSTLLSSAEKTIISDKELQKSADENIKSLEKQNSKLKTKNFITTYIIPPLVFIGGIYLGTQATK